jgi:hypothetical protein
VGFASNILSPPEVLATRIRVHQRSSARRSLLSAKASAAEDGTGGSAVRFCMDTANPRKKQRFSTKSHQIAPNRTKKNIFAWQKRASSGHLEPPPSH